MNHNPYPAIRFIVRHGPLTAVLAPIILLAVWLVACFAYALPVWTVFAAVAVALILFGLLRSYVELVQVISETLLPR